jgi:hypothetical protein
MPKVAQISTLAALESSRSAILRCKTLTELEDAITFIREDGGKTFETLVIDPITVFYDVLKDAMSRMREAQKKEMTYREWAKINGKMRSLYERLTGLPVHVIVIAREATEYEGTGDSLKRVGNKPDADKALMYMFDYSVKFNDDHSGVVKKSRGFNIGNTLDKVGWSVFEKASLAFVDGETAKHQADDEAVDREMSNFAEDEKPAPPANGNGHQQEPPDEQPLHWFDEKYTVVRNATIMKSVWPNHSRSRKEARQGHTRVCQRQGCGSGNQGHR